MDAWKKCATALMGLDEDTTEGWDEADWDAALDEGIGRIHGDGALATAKVSQRILPQSQLSRFGKIRNKKHRRKDRKRVGARIKVVT